MNIYYDRAILKEFEKKLVPNKVLLLLGARRVGKTELLNNFTKKIDASKTLKLNGEDIQDMKLLSERSLVNYQRLLHNIEYLIIDEAQNIPEIGIILKFIVDNIKGIKVVATGSSMFDLTNKLGEPLVGRKNTLYLFPLSQIEFSQIENFKTTSENLEKRLLFGSYPELEQYNDWSEKTDYLFEMINSYLLKDILILDDIKHANKLYDLLRMIALQIGKEVSLQELGNALNLSKNTVDKYLDLLSKVFIVYKIEGFSKNLRKEIVKSSRYYFYDNGIRNALINNFNRLEMRNDVGELWENYLASERIKKQNYQKIKANNYFWRTYDQQEIDWIETQNDNLSAFEFKWNENSKVRIPGAFAKNYPNASFEIVDKSNYLDFIM